MTTTECVRCRDDAERSGLCRLCELDAIADAREFAQADPDR